MARTLTENGDSEGYRTWRVYLAVLAALLTMASTVAGTEYLGKVRDEAVEIGDPAKALKRYTAVVDQIRDDVLSKQLLHWILQDEQNTIRWVIETCAILNPAR